MCSHTVPPRRMRALTVECKGMQTQLQSCTAHSQQPEESTPHEAELLQGQPLFLGRSLSDSSKTNFLATVFGDSHSQAATLDCNDSGRQAARSSSLTEQQPSSVSQPDHCKPLARPPAAPRQKLPQHTFAHHSTATCPAKPVLDGMSESSLGLCQRPLDCCTQFEAMQAEPTTSQPQDAARAASMSALLAVAQPVSSAEELLQRLQYGSIAATTNTSNGDEQHSGNNVFPDLTSFKANHTGAAARRLGAALPCCPLCCPAFTVQIETGSFHDDQEARPQPTSCAGTTQLVDNWLAHSHEQTEGYGEFAHHGIGGAKGKDFSETC